MRDADYRVKEACPVKKIRSDNVTVDPQTAVVKKNIHNRELTYYLVPVWLMNITYDKANYTIAMNGQTEEMCTDDLPENPLYYRLFKIIYLILQLIEFGLGSLLIKRFISEAGFNSDMIGIIIMMLLLCIFIPVVFNVTVSSVICKIVFRKKRKKVGPIEKIAFLCR